MSAKRPEPRKLPQQERSRVLFDAILEAGAEMLERDGPEFTLQAVATRAGVSPGSLYQYFPEKDALVGALIDRQIAHDTQQLQAFRAMTLEYEGDVADVIVDGVLRLYSTRPGLMVQMFLLMHQVGRLGDLASISRAFQTTICEMLIKKHPSRTSAQCEAAAEIALFSVLGTVRQVATSRPSALREPEFRERLLSLCREALG